MIHIPRHCSSSQAQFSCNTNSVLSPLFTHYLPLLLFHGKSNKTHTTPHTPSGRNKSRSNPEATQTGRPGCDSPSSYHRSGVFCLPVPELLLVLDCFLCLVLPSCLARGPAAGKLGRHGHCFHGFLLLLFFFFLFPSSTSLPKATHNAQSLFTGTSSRADQPFCSHRRLTTHTISSTDNPPSPLLRGWPSV